VSWLRFSFESRLDELFLVSMIIRQLCQHLRLNEVQAYQIELCTVEAVTNVIRHAYHEQPGNEVTVLVSFSDTRIDLEISDRGESMTPHFVEQLRSGSQILESDIGDLMAVPEGGLGLQIIRQLMDEKSYSTDGGVNHLKLTRFLNRET